MNLKNILKYFFYIRIKLIGLFLYCLKKSWIVKCFFNMMMINIFDIFELLDLNSKPKKNSNIKQKKKKKKNLFFNFFFFFFKI